MTDKPKVRAAKPGEVVSFRRSDVEEAIREIVKELGLIDARRENLMGRMQTLRQLLRYFDPEAPLGGSESEDASPAKPSAAERIASIRFQVTGEPRDANEPTPERAQKLADLAYRVLSEAPGGVAKTEVIATTLELLGTPIGGEMPLATLTTALRRDRRFERVPGDRGLWRLAPPPVRRARAPEEQP